MRLKKFIIENFRGYKEAEIKVGDFTTIVGKNDVGKSALMEAMDIFFNDKKLDIEDRNIYSGEEDIVLTAIFDNVPEKIRLDANAYTSLRNEYLLNSDGDLEIKRVFSGERLTKKDYIVAYFPDDDFVKEIHSLTIDKLRKKYKDLISDVDQRVSSQIRVEVLKQSVKKGAKLKNVEIQISNTKLRDINDQIYRELPLFQLFKSDRSNTDSDSEIQDPIKAIVKSTLVNEKDIITKLNDVVNEVKDAVSKTAQETLNMLKDMNEDLANDLTPHLSTPKWESVFKFSLETDSGIPLNKRGSGVRRLILLNFFRSQAKKKLIEKEKNGNIIYAFEEPETAQHPSNQKMLIDSLKKISDNEYTQILITTHSPEIAKITPREDINLVKKINEGLPVSRIYESNKEQLDEIVKELGIIPNIKLYSDQLSILVLVEGPTDAEFFQNLYEQYWNENNHLEHNIAFIPMGGNTSVEDFVNLEFIKQINPKKIFTILDGDSSSMNLELDAENILLKKETIEFYLPCEIIKNSLTNNLRRDFIESFEETWEDSPKKLHSKMKSKLKKEHVYRTLNINDLLPDDWEEIKGIFLKLNEDMKV